MGPRFRLPRSAATATVELAPDAVFGVDSAGRIVFANQSAARIFGYGAGGLLGRPFELLVPGLLVEHFHDDVPGRAGSAVAATVVGAGAQLRGRREDGTEFPAQARIMSSAKGRKGVVSVIVTDRSEQVELLRRLERRTALTGSIVDSVAGFVTVLDGGGVIRLLSQAVPAWIARDLFDPSPYLGSPYVRFAREVPCLGPACAELVGAVNELLAGSTDRFDLDVAGSNGGQRQPTWIEVVARRLAGSQPGFVITHQDITDRKTAESELMRLGEHDPLTGLANRARLKDCVEQSLRRDPPTRATVLFIDVDDFKSVNDTLGYSAGDVILCETARRLERVHRSGDTLARFGGDEFVLVCDGVSSTDEAGQVASRVRDTIASPYIVSGREIFITASVGVASVQPDWSEDGDTVIGAAEAAMYQAKKAGRSQIAVFNPSMDEDGKRRWQVEQQLTGALKRGEFRVHYQPIVKLENGEMIGAEALVRWLSPSLGTVLADEFIPIAESKGLINEIGGWVIQEACRQMVAWSHGDGPPLRLSVNVSPRQLVDPYFVSHIAMTMRGAGLDADRLSIEITETALMTDPDAAKATLEELVGLGVHIALDDFGTGYGSLAYLSRFPISCIKIHKSFVQGLGVRSHDDSIVRAVIVLARGLDLHLVAEGVETEVQRQILLQEGCREGLGYLFSPAVPPEELVATQRFAAPRTDPAVARSEPTKPAG